ncbi:shufflon system plasmid conjugative transfer pilus tip adhesin PilV [Burkholderia cepacia]|uniref:Shufflon system plasmid conjugative transfer pilus tip adhesin PilV n=1 Tax=Burkholderia contaminans TaxID=488447 RepID=A0ABD7YFR5_9BURK|nr:MULTISPECIES: shufflon system plasmid conjugative transfer pilus tip adhesin PilV [Burkholderia]EKS9798991.1 shufflon system plasmid conjugative transfer pilus tip adhesin PilV [Burkholderia cepacia]EKS9805945.1 shufflon system plasmid conjugative transfer pilus tip adhesin PilV [Burkholderia cepacia]EKS9813493.1 shufflon system plasmid conjugative transfer pilus tip adhesin PilV [Burkholderia cepacia]EKS9820332.1 shufflon system plasmid conjugative transfer pilus tip adhesin PilV [Burkholde
MQAVLGTWYGALMWLVMAGSLTVWLQHSATAIKVAGAGNQAQVVASAMGRYVKDHGADLAATATAAQPVTVSMNDLQAGGYLVAGVSSTNVYRQQWFAQVLQPQPGQLQTMLFSSGGVAIPARDVATVAAQSSGRGNLGGFVPYPNQAGDATLQPTIAVGAGGSFRQSLVSYANPGSGHLAMLVGVADAPSDNGFLYRVPMPNRPELNNMQTDLGLTDTQGVAHDINGVNTANANTFRLANGAGMKGDQGGAIELGDMAGNNPGQAPYIDFHLGGQGAQDFNARFQNNADGNIRVSGAKGNGSLDVEGTLQAGNIATPGTYCPTNGKIAGNADGSGQILSCQFHTWMPIGGRWLRYGYYTVYDAWWVPQPTCPNGGSMQIQVTPQNFVVNDTTAVNTGPATWTGNGWQVHLTDGNGNGIPGAQGIAATYCSY